MKTSELTGIALDWSVAKCEGVEVEYIDDGITQCLLRKTSGRYVPSIDWAQGGPIIEREKITVCFDTCRPRWVGCDWDARLTEFGETPLIAAMRCYVASKLGDEVELPKGL
jgi:hypothetical protein